MSYPPPPGTNSSLPPRPPPPTIVRSYSSATTSAPASTPTFGFRPRQVAAPSSVISAPPQHQYQQPGYPHQMGYMNRGGGYMAQQHHQQQQHLQQTSYSAAPTISSAPQIVNPFPLPTQQSAYHNNGGMGGPNGGGGGGGGGGAGGRRGADPRYADLDPELQAQIAQQQSIYDPSNTDNLKARLAASKHSASSTAAAAAAAVLPSPSSSTPLVATADGQLPDGSAALAATSSATPGVKAPTVLRQGGGQTWTDSTLLEWDPSHFRLFVGNLAGEVTDDSLLKAFSKYPSCQKARVVRDKRTTKSKGYGFVSFSDGDEYFRAAREMNGKYIGSHPVLLKRSNTEIRPTVVGGRGRGGKVVGGRVDKKKGKAKRGGGEKSVLG